MKHLKPYKKIFHCLVPYNDEKIFKIALTKINIPEEIRKEIFTYLYNNNYLDDDKIYGYFLRFNLPEWDFYQLHGNEDKEDLIYLLQDATYNSDGEVSELSPGNSKYIGVIKPTKDEIDFYDATTKYNI